MANGKDQQNCVNQFVGANGIAGCNNDPTCICKDQSFLGDIACCLAKPGGCNQNDQSSAVAFAQTICKVQGISVPTTVSCSTSFTSSASGTGATPTTTGGAGGGGSNTSAGVTGASQTPSSKTSPNIGLPRETGMGSAGVLGGVIAVGMALL